MAHDEDLVFEYQKSRASTSIDSHAPKSSKSTDERELNMKADVKTAQPHETEDLKKNGSA
jgi:hypothetical protein